MYRVEFGESARDTKIFDSTGRRMTGVVGLRIELRPDGTQRKGFIAFRVNEPFEFSVPGGVDLTDVMRIEAGAASVHFEPGVRFVPRTSPSDEDLAAYVLDLNRLAKEFGARR